jgi:hypothetical protein
MEKAGAAVKTVAAITRLVRRRRTISFPIILAFVGT